MTDNLSRSERLDMASRMFYDYRQREDDTDLPAYEYLSDQELMATLIGDMRHYADWRGIDFDSAIAAGNAAYFQRRAREEYPYSLGEEVEHPQRHRNQESTEDGAHLTSRGVVTSIYTERDGTQTYYVRFLGETDAWPLKSADLRPAPAFPRIAANQGTLESLAEAERVLVETAARIRSFQMRDTPPSARDITDRDKISAALAEACDLAATDILRLLEPQIAAWTAEITKPWRPVRVSHPNEVAALDFPQPIQAITGSHSQSADLGPRTETAQRAHGLRPW